MPELPELQALAEGLTAHLARREVAGVHEHHPATLKTQRTDAAKQRQEENGRMVEEHFTGI